MGKLRQLSPELWPLIYVILFSYIELIFRGGVSCLPAVLLFVLQKLSSIFQPVLAFSSDVHFNSIDVLFPAFKQEVVLSILMPLPFACQLRPEVNLPSYLIFRDSSINLACAVDTHALELIIPLPLKD